MCKERYVLDFRWFYRLQLRLDDIISQFENDNMNMFHVLKDNQKMKIIR